MIMAQTGANGKHDSFPEYQSHTLHGASYSLTSGTWYDGASCGGCSVEEPGAREWIMVLFFIKIRERFTLPFV